MLAKNPVQLVQYAEIALNKLAQQNLRFAEPLWVFLSEYFSTAQVMDVLVPLLGAFQHPLLVQLVCSLGTINAVASLVKWVAPAYRPYWWIREFPHLQNVSGLQQHSLTCETSAGFPSSHVMCFTAFVYIVSVFSFPFCRHKLHLRPQTIINFAHAFVLLAILGMWISRLYLATQFLHQCLVGSFASIVLLNYFDAYAIFLNNLRTRVYVAVVFACGVLAVICYFVMIQLDADPHWSVRMAFKWCEDPSYLRHEDSPIFVLARDLGYLTGVSFAMPILKSNKLDCKPFSLKRLPVILAIMLLNLLMRWNTPKQNGRFIFVSYEFVRNLLHSYSLLSTVKIGKIKPHTM